MPDNIQEIDNRSLFEKLMDENPLIKSGIKKVQKNQDEHIDQAMQAGVPATDILKQLITMHSPQNAMTAGSATQNAQGGIDIQKGGWVNRFGQALGGVDSANADLERLLAATKIQGGQLENTLAKQKISGTEPIQPVQKSKVSMEEGIAEAMKKGAFVQHVDMVNGGITTSDNPNAYPMLVNPTTQGLQYTPLDKFANVNQTISAISTADKALASTESPMQKIKSFFGNVSPERKKIAEQLVNLSTVASNKAMKGMQQKSTGFTYKPGEKRVINGLTYTRNNDGQWVGGK